MKGSLLNIGIKLGYSAAILIGAYIFYKILARPLLIQARKKWGEHQATLLRKLFLYGVFLIAIIWILSIFGVSVGALLTALGLFSVAVGFAAQTSLSNLISGIFLLFDRPFVIGDVVDIGGQVGIVLSIDLLSTKLRTFDNFFIRIPNATVLNSVVKNITKFEIRRIDVEVGIAYGEDIGKAKKALLDFLKSCPLVLAEPEPIVFTVSLGESSVNLKLRAWIKRADYIKAVDTLTQGAKEALEKAGIEIPFPQIVVHFPKGNNGEVNEERS